LKRFLILRAPLFAVALAAAQPAFAQQPATPPANSAAPNGMVLPVITPSHLAAARAVVVSSGLARSFDTNVPELMGQLYATVTQTRPELTNDLKDVLKNLQPEFQQQTAQVLDLAATAVAGQISESDLKQINDFFNSPSGKKYVDAQPEILTHIMDSIRSMTQQMSERMMTRVRDEMKKRGKTL
jgi:hypothetical protein